MESTQGKSLQNNHTRQIALTRKDILYKLIAREEWLALDLTSPQEHSHHRVDDRGSLVCLSIVVREPLKHDQEVHVAEHGNEHERLWDEFMVKVNIVLEVDIVEPFHHLTEQHVGNTYYDCDFHLERVDVVDLALCTVPGWIDAERIDALSILQLAIAILIAGVKELQGQRHEVIVHEAAVDCEKSHQE